MLVQVKTDSPVSVVGWCLRYNANDNALEPQVTVLEVVMRTATGIAGTDDLGLVGMEFDEKAGNNLDHEKTV